MSIATRYSLDRSDGLIVVERCQDVEPIIEENKRLQSVHQKCDWGRHVATIPNVFLERWFNEEYARGNTTVRIYTKEFDEIIAKKLRDPEWAFLRVDGPRHFVGWGQ